MSQFYIHGAVQSYYEQTREKNLPVLKETEVVSTTYPHMTSYPSHPQIRNKIYYWKITCHNPKC